LKKFFRSWGLSPHCSYSIPHLHTKCNRQNAQNWEFYKRNFCANFLLTNCVGCGIMVNSALDIRRRAANYTTLFGFCQ
jgi:hypothetical protein